MCTCNNMAVTFFEQFLIFIQSLLLLKMYIFVFYAHLYFVQKGNYCMVAWEEAWTSWTWCLLIPRYRFLTAKLFRWGYLFYFSCVQNLQCFSQTCGSVLPLWKSLGLVLCSQFFAFHLPLVHFGSSPLNMISALTRVAGLLCDPHEIIPYLLKSKALLSQ